MKPHIFHPRADEEYVEAVRYYADVSPKLAARFHAEAERSIRELCRQPGRYFQFDPPARRALVQKFPYSVVFLEKEDQIWIVAVMHTKRRPGYWRERLS